MMIMTCSFSVPLVQGGSTIILVTMLQPVFRKRVRQAVWHDARTGTWSYNFVILDLPDGLDR